MVVQIQRKQSYLKPVRSIHFHKQVIIHRLPSTEGQSKAVSEYTSNEDEECVVAIIQKILMLCL